MKISISRYQTKRQPGDGFYLYVNGPWIQTHHIDPWRSEYTASDEIEKKTDAQLLRLLESLPKRSLGQGRSLESVNLTARSTRDHLQLFRSIWLQTDFSREEGFLRICLQNLTGSTSVEFIAHFFGWMCRSQISTVLQISKDKQIKSPYHVQPALSPGKLILPTKYYTDTNLQKSDTWAAYINFVSTCSVELGLPFLIKGIDAEIHLAKAVSKFSDGDPIERRSLETFHSDFDWTHFMEGYGLIPSWRSKLWILNSPKVLQTILTCICSLNTEEVVGLFALHFIRFCSFHLRPSIQKAMENLFGSSLLGVKGSAPKSLKYLSAVKEVLPAALCNLYSDEQSKIQNLKEIHSFVKTIQDSTVAILQDSKMFSKKTHSQVIEKIHRMKLLIGKGFENTLPTVVYSPESLLNTILRISSQTALISLKDLGHPVNRERGLYPCFQVNASYFPEMNEIILPWGILQDPFYKKDAALGWNYGGLGAVIGHEITHAFDLEGSLYTARAVYKDTWTRRNRDAFKRKTRKVVQFYSRFKHFKHKVDGKKTVSENWADLGGLKISLDALKNQMDLRELSPEERKKAYQTFFIAYATSWRSLVRKKKMLFSMMTSVHAPAEDRVDRLVPQFQEWVDAFDIQENDHLYLKPSERLHFF